jgi:hypothetical protein
MSGPVELTVKTDGAHLVEGNKVILTANGYDFWLDTERGNQPEIAWKSRDNRGQRAKLEQKTSGTDDIELWRFDRVLVEHANKKRVLHTFVMQVLEADVNGDPTYVVITGWSHDDAGGDHGGGAHAQK